MKAGLTASLAALASIGLALAVPNARAQEGGPTIDGRWHLAISVEAARARIDRGIEAATDGMPPLVDAMAQDRLRERTPPIRQVEIATTPARIVVRLDGRTYETAPGAHRRVRAAGGGSEHVRLVQHFRDGNLEQTFQAAQGTRWNTFVLDDGGETMTLNAVVQSERLPNAVHFSLPYRRAR